MENDFLDMKDVERMLKPRCEFHTSPGFNDRVLNAAENRRQMKSRRMGMWRYWIAAACVALIAMSVSLVYDSNEGIEPIENKIATIEPSVDMATGVSDPQQVASTHDVNRIDGGESRREPALIPVKSHKNMAMTKAKKDNGADTLRKGGIAGVLTETDIPVTNSGNMTLDSVEIAQIIRQEQIAFVERMRLSVEIAENLVKNNINN